MPTIVGESCRIIKFLLHIGTNQGILIASAAVVSYSIAAIIIASLRLIIGFCCGCFCHKWHKVKNRKKPRPRRLTSPKELHYNLHPSIKQEQSMELSEQMQPSIPQSCTMMSSHILSEILISIC